MLHKWAAVIGLVLTAVGIMIGFYLPTIAARWSGPETLTQEFWLQFRFVVGIALILVGTGLQRADRSIASVAPKTVAPNHPSCRCSIHYFLPRRRAGR